ncbi:MAG: hypothetical protein AAB879_01075 [Patescibacteria group bacterium]
MKTTFWGVRGSVPSPISGIKIEQKIARVIHAAREASLPRGASHAAILDWLRANIPFEERSTFGNSTFLNDPFSTSKPVTVTWPVFHLHVIYDTLS